MKKIGLTGGIGSGKSFIAGILQKMGYPVFFSDDFAKNIYDTDASVKETIIGYFGAQLYVEGQLDRTKLAQLIFENEENRLFVNQLVHPKVRQAFSDWAAKQDASIVFNEAAILFETGAYKNFDATILVTAPIELRVQRVMARDHSSKEEVLARMSKQWSDEQKIALTNFVIMNDEEMPILEQIEKILSNL